MNDIAHVLSAIANTSGYNDKLALLERHKRCAGLEEVLKFIYNPYCKTGISDAKLTKVMNSAGSTRSVVLLDEALDYFKTHQTGSNKDLLYAKSFIDTCQARYGHRAAELAKAIVTQNLKIGITATSLNKVYGSNFIPKVGCMLGSLYESVGPEKTKWPCIVTEKLDGVRRILVKEDGVCRFYSRSGHEDTGLIDIVAEAKHLPNNFVYDGELLAEGHFSNSIAHRQATFSVANCKGAKAGLIFNIFDMIPVQDFYRGTCNIPAMERKIRLAATLKDDSLQRIDDEWIQRQRAFGIDEELKWIKPVPILGMVNNLHEAEPIIEEIWSDGGEGIMLNTVSGPYEIKRSKHLLKVKHTEEHVLEVVGMIEGTGKYEDALGAIVVNYKGNKVGVGSGFTDAERRAIWDNPTIYIGRMVEVETFGESINAQGYVSLNCPIYKRFVGEEE